jgi:hypothetical protein
MMLIFGFFIDLKASRPLQRKERAGSDIVSKVTSVLGGIDEHTIVQAPATMEAFEIVAFTGCAGAELSEVLVSHVLTRVQVNESGLKGDQPTNLWSSPLHSLCTPTRQPVSLV